MTLKVPIIFGGEFYFTLRSQFALGTLRSLGSHGTSTEITPDLLTPTHCLHPQHQSLLLNLSFFTNELFIWDIMQDLSLGVFSCIVQRAAAQSARFQRNTKLFLIWWGNFSVEVQAREFGESPESASLSSNNSPLAIVLEHMALQENENHHFNSIYFYWNNSVACFQSWLLEMWASGELVPILWIPCLDQPGITKILFISSGEKVKSISETSETKIRIQV